VTIQVSTTDARTAKALELLSGADRWLKIRRKADGVKLYVVPGSNGRVYWVNLHECSCPDHTNRGVACKHMTAVALHVARVNAERPKTRRASKPIPAASIPDTFAAAAPVDGTAAELARRQKLAATATEIWGCDGE
jgi:predicted nucleic acid-binding Zn finger protein